MSIEYDLTIKLSPKDVRQIVADHVNKNLGADFKVSADKIRFEICSQPAAYDIDSFETVLNEVSVQADYIPKRSRGRTV